MRGNAINEPDAGSRSLLAICLKAVSAHLIFTVRIAVHQNSEPMFLLPGTTKLEARIWNLVFLNSMNIDYVESNQCT